MKRLSFFVCFLVIFVNANAQDKNATKGDEVIISSLAEQGKITYTKKCASCHGQNGEIAPYGVGDKLSKLSGKEIVNAVRSYKVDTAFGYKYKAIMQLQSTKVNEAELKQIVAYLKGDEVYESFTIFSPDGNTDISTTPSEQGVYIQ